jgi:hypothetical protein
VLAHGLDYLGPQMNNARFRPPYYLDSSDPHAKAANGQTSGKFVRRLTTIDYNFVSARFRSFPP